jgi:hypothetical protein
MSKVAKKAQAEFPNREAASVDRRFWTVSIEPDTFTDLATHITAGTLIIKNLGPESVMIDTGYGADDMRLRLRPGQARIMAVQSHIRVGTTGASPALVEFDFMPALIS